MEQPKIQMSTLGGFTLTYAGKPMTLGRGKMTKSVQFLQLLLLHPDTGVTKEEVIQILYNWDESRDSNNSLNSLVYRLKNQLIAAGLPKEEMIQIRDGVCKWQSTVPTEVDAVMMKSQVGKAACLSGDEKLEVLTEALGLYKGEFLPELSNEFWVTVESVRLKKLYISCVFQIAELLEEKQDYEQLLEIYKRAAELYPFDEWQERQIECLQKMGRFDEAYHVYQNTARLYSDELGTLPSIKMREQLQKMNGKMISNEHDFQKIQEDLKEQEWKFGAYYCAYPSFVDMYRLMCRLIERSGESVQLMACMLAGNNKDGECIRKAEKVLSESIRNGLRRGDAYTYYGENLFLLLLSATKRENCDIIFERISGRFYENIDSDGFKLEFEVAEVYAAERHEAPQVVFAKKNKVW